jgi:crotonobetainyl-CoA:carnitine CoA-transferase CaiB-like acyl-CoA transferase
LNDEKATRFAWPFVFVALQHFHDLLCVMGSSFSSFQSEIHAALGETFSPPAPIEIAAAPSYPSFFQVNDLALAATYAAVQEYAALVGAKSFEIDRRLALLWFHLTTRPVGWTPGSVWDAIAGDYECADGWVRLHTNAPHHQKAAVEVLGCAPERDAVVRALEARSKFDVQDAIVANHGCAAAMMSLEEWAAHPQGKSVAAEPLIDWAYRDGERRTRKDLYGLKVLDLTRVLAGPVATRFLAGFGADVLRIDPPHWNEPAVEVEVTLGKRCAGLDLRQGEDREVLKGLIRDADLLVHGYRPGALDGIGFGAETLRTLNPNLCDISLCAYGWTGPWATRRGFDSLVQMSCGIADEGMKRSGAGRPVPLPVQALDFATGYFVAAAALRAFRVQNLDGTVSSGRLSLARTAHMLTSSGASTLTGDKLAPQDRDFSKALEETTWGKVQRVTPPYTVDGQRPVWTIPAGALRRHAASWSN